MNGYIERLMACAAKHPDIVAVREHESQRQFTYAQTQHQIEALRGQMSALNIKPGDRVLLMLPLGAEFIFAFYALTSLQAVALIVSPNLTSWELASALKKLKPTGVVTDHERLQTYASAFSTLKPLHFALSIDTAPNDSPLPCRIASEMTASPLALTAMGENNPVVTCHETYKGLTTPVSVLHRYHDYTHSTAGMAEAMAHRLLPGDVVIGWLPLYSVYSLTGSVIMALCNGCTVLLVEKIRSNFLQLISESNARLVPLIPPMVPLLLRQCEGKPVPPLHPHLYLCCGGSKLSRALAKRVKAALGMDLCEGYGTTETLPIIVNYPGLSRPGSIGKSIVPANKVAILDAHGRELPPGEENIGEIAVMGPTVTEGFLDDPLHGEQFFRDGWFHTGDLGWRDEDGYFYFVGRRIAITKIAAQMVDLREVELVLARHPGVNQARTIVRADEGECEQLVASVMEKPGIKIDTRMLREHCRKYLSPHKIPKRFNIYPMAA